MDRVPVGISSCLLGEAVRYDGGHKRQDLLRSVLDPHVRWVPFCPEVLAGLGVPRPPIQLRGPPESRRVVEVESGRDHTVALVAAAAGIVEAARAAQVRGFVLKSRSPSCGLGDAAVDGVQPGTADGILVMALRGMHPGLPLATERDLESGDACRAFLDRVRAFVR